MERMQAGLARVIGGIDPAARCAGIARQHPQHQAEPPARVVFDDLFGNAKISRGFLLRKPLDAARLDRVAIGGRERGDEIEHAPKLKPRPHDAFGRGRLVGQPAERRILDRLEPGDAVAPGIVREDRAHRREEIGAAVLDMIDAGQLGEAAIGLLDHIVDFGRRGTAMAQPGTHPRFVRDDVRGDPADRLVAMILYPQNA